MSLTERQQDIMDFIRAHRDKHGYPPSYREIGRHFGIRSPNGVSAHLKALERKGFIACDDRCARGIRILTGGWRVERHGGYVRVHSDGDLSPESARLLCAKIVQTCQEIEGAFNERVTSPRPGNSLPEPTAPAPQPSLPG